MMVTKVNDFSIKPRCNSYVYILLLLYNINWSKKYNTLYVCWCHIINVNFNDVVTTFHNHNSNNINTFNIKYILSWHKYYKIRRDFILVLL
jgi:hypothetical protein